MNGAWCHCRRGETHRNRLIKCARDLTSKARKIDETVFLTVPSAREHSADISWLLIPASINSSTLSCVAFSVSLALGPSENLAIDVAATAAMGGRRGPGRRRSPQALQAKLLR